ncbi:DNA polymerase sliding clamp [Nitrosopumilaceae archaeon]|nr:proliferating cell nuclear antigen (pcna) [Alphaproteobacteria bacterium]MDA8029929.1 proliferating cell nuclear antigen (pcna) [Alphaproteobacteria bacterium]CAI9831564.1 DNA polymerase sliding clamp [Nitrosopumilaceae archaeon]
MLNMQTKGSDDLKAVISAVSTLVEEATFEANKDGITFKGMDPAHVALIDLAWPASAFEKFTCDETLNFGVRIDEFSKIIKRSAKTDDITISIEGVMLTVRIGKQKTYKLRLIESSASETPIPKLDYTAKVVMPHQQFDKCLGDIGVVSDYIDVSVKEGGDVAFMGRGDSGEVEVTIDDIKESSAIKDSKGTYSLEYLNPVVKAVGGSTGDVTFELVDAKPLRIEFKVANVGRIHFYLAPRVDS